MPTSPRRNRPRPWGAPRLRPASRAGLYARERGSSDDLATVISCSGSTGKPKGVMLSHRNVLSNLEGMIQMFRVDSHGPHIGGVLPFFPLVWLHRHALVPHGCGLRRALHPQPDGREGLWGYPRLWGGTMLIGTPV